MHQIAAAATNAPSTSAPLGTPGHNREVLGPVEVLINRCSRGMFAGSAVAETSRAVNDDLCLRAEPTRCLLEGF